MYRSGLVPRVIPLMGLIGAPLLLTVDDRDALRRQRRHSPLWSLAAVAPIFVWELSLGVYLAVKGFKPCGRSPRTRPCTRDDASRRAVAMKAIVQERFGPPDVLQFVDTDQPGIGPDDVLVRVHAAAVNPYDWHMHARRPVRRPAHGQRSG